MIFALLAESDDALKLGTVLESRFSGAHLRVGASQWLIRAPGTAKDLSAARQGFPGPRRSGRGTPRHALSEAEGTVPAFPSLLPLGEGEAPP